MSPAAKKSRFFDFLLIFAVAYLLSQAVQGWFFPKTDPSVVAGAVKISMADSTLRDGANPIVRLENPATSVDNGGILDKGQYWWCRITNDANACRSLERVAHGKPVALPDRCPDPPFDIYNVEFQDDGSERLTPVTSSGTITVPCDHATVINPGEKVDIQLAPWKYSLFSRFGTYEVRMPASGSGETIAGSGAVTASTRFTLSEAGGITKLYRAIITKPFLNFLILIAAVIPGHSLGLGIILLTILVKLILFYPTQKSLEGQKKMQLLQPKLDEVRKKYEGDPKKQQEETMKLWKEHKINPLQSCLPILLQFPILIGLFHVIRDGATLELSRHLIYPFYQTIDWTFNMQFLGLDLTQPNVWIFPPLLIVLQFIQMKLSFHIADKKKAKQIDKAMHSPIHTPEKTAQDMQQKIMLYMFPLMIGFFAIRFPSAVALYWGVSTLFAIGQQLIVNREHLKVKE